MTLGVREENKSSLGFKWGNKRIVNAKDSKNQVYKSFSFKGVEYFIADNVYLFSEDTVEAYVGKLVNIWETPSKEKKIRVVWFLRPREICNFLRDYVPRWNELFLASGDGKGVTNVAPLESLLGKCHVVCASRDRRNAMPSDSVLREADFFFSHVFDVQTCTILEKFPDTIYKWPVEFFFNKNDHKTIRPNSNLGGPEEPGGTKLWSGKESGNYTVNASTSETSNAQAKDTNTEDLIGRDNSCALAGPPRKFKIKIKKHESDDENEAKIRTEDLQKLSSENQPLKKRKLVGDVYADIKEDNEFPVLPKEEQPVNPSDSLLGRLDYKSEVPEADLAAGPRTLAEDIEALEYALVQDATIESKVNEFMMMLDYELARTKSLGPIGGKASGDEAPIDVLDKDAMNMMENKDVVANRRPDAINYGSMSPTKKLADGASMHANGEAHDQLALPCAQDDVPEFERKVWEVTRRAAVDKRKWFDALPWEERMKNADKERSRLWFRNLDPSYTSAEVEDIIWSAFEVRADAKVIPPQSFSGSYYGQALVIFKSQDAADTVMSMLRHRCLMVNGRPLVARRPPKECGEPGTFHGHIAIDKVRTKLEQRNAVSTSHCAQVNTAEYEFALDWLALQEKADLWWKALHKEQAKEISECISHLKFCPMYPEPLAVQEASNTLVVQEAAKMGEPNGTAIAMVDNSNIC